MSKHVFVVLAALLAFVLDGVLPSHAEPASRATGFGRVTYIEGSASVRLTPTARFRDLVEGNLIRPGQLIRTAPDSRIELTFLDGSIVRVAAESEYQIEAGEFSGTTRSRLSSRLNRGRVWARVVPTARPMRRPFDIVTPSAMIGVRGTTYDLIAAADTSTEVSVYDGQVGVSPPLIEEGADHEEIAWPEEVTEEEWEEIILGKLQRLRIDADGQAGTPEPFVPEDEQDPWVLWNQARDGA